MWNYILLWLCYCSTEAINPIVIKGPYLFDSVTKERFFIKGVSYSPDAYNYEEKKILSEVGDYISDNNQYIWERDLPLLAAMGINCLRIYNVFPGLSHDLFMNALARHGIYAIISVTASVGTGVLDNSLQSPNCYKSGLVRSAKEIVVSFSKYPNTLAFVAGNEVAKEVNHRGPLSLGAIPCVKALLRDLRIFMKSCSCGMRYIPLMYAATDFRDYGNFETRNLISQYINCRKESSDFPDMYGVNIYTWCSNKSTYSKSYRKVDEAYMDYPIPIIFSEFGCNVGDFDSRHPFTSNQRTWKQVDTLFGTKMRDVWSGGIAYEYSMADNNYGMVLLPQYEYGQTDIIKLENYYNLANHYNNIVFPMSNNSWTDEDRCQWVPLFNTSSRFRPDCPSNTTVQDFFTKVKLNEKENWISSPLPPILTGDVVNVRCGVYPLSTVDQQENECQSGSCKCEEIPFDLRCKVKWDNKTNPNITYDFFKQVCGIFDNFGTQELRTICTDNFYPPAKYAACTHIQQANFLLNEWMDFKGECCANIVDEKKCDQEIALLTILGPYDDEIEWRGSVEMTVTVPNGNPPYNYQWWILREPFSTSKWSQIKNSNNPSYKIVHAEKGALFKVQVTDSTTPKMAYGWSSEARLIVYPAATLIIRLDLRNVQKEELILHKTKFINAISNSLNGIVRAQDMILENEMDFAQGEIRVRVWIKMFLDPINKQNISKLFENQINNKHMQRALEAQGLYYIPENIVPECDPNISPPDGAFMNCSELNVNGYFALNSTCNFTCFSDYIETNTSLHICVAGQWYRIGHRIKCKKKALPTPSTPPRPFPFWMIGVIALCLSLSCVTTIKHYVDARGRQLTRRYFELQGPPKEFENPR